VGRAHDIRSPDVTRQAHTRRRAPGRIEPLSTCSHLFPPVPGNGVQLFRCSHPLGGNSRNSSREAQLDGGAGTGDKVQSVEFRGPRADQTTPDASMSFSSCRIAAARPGTLSTTLATDAGS
jgi:hypothetical protein